MRTAIISLARLCFGYALQAQSLGQMTLAVCAERCGQRCHVYEQMTFAIAAPCVVCTGCGTYVQVYGDRVLWNVSHQQWMADSNKGYWRSKCTHCRKRLFKSADIAGLKALRLLLAECSPGEQAEFWIQLGLKQRP